MTKKRRGNIEDLNLTLVDFETSGLDFRNDQVIEACVIRVRKGEPVLVFNTLVNFEAELNPKVTEMTGHTLEDLQGGITEEMLAHALYSIIKKDEVVVAYNAGFDLSFLEKMIQDHVYTEEFKLKNPFIDPLTIARDRDPYPHKLKDSCNRYGIVLEDAHSAYNDTFAMLDLIIEMHKQGDIYEYLNVMGYRSKYGEPEWIPDHATLKKQGTETIQHGKPKPNALKPKKHGVVVTKNTARKKIPDPVAQLPKDLEAMPNVHPTLQSALDALIDGAVSNSLYSKNYPSVNIPHHEIKNSKSYLTNVRGIPETDYEIVFPEEDSDSVGIIYHGELLK